MKESAKRSPFFSAYSLKTFEQASASSVEISPSPFLRAILSGKAKAINRTRVFPMINPYQEKHVHIPVDKALSRTAGKESNFIPGDIAITEKHWFQHYE